MESIRITKSEIILFIALVLSTILWCYSFALVGITWNDLFSYSFSLIQQKLFSPNFFVFIFLMPLSLALLCAFAEKIGRMELRIVSVLGAITGISLSVLLLEVIKDYVIVGIFYVIALLVMAEITSRKIGEKGRFARIKAYSEGLRKFTVVLGLGFFVAGVLTIYPAQEEHIARMENALLSGIQENEGNVNGIGNMIAMNNINVQREFLKQIMNDPNFQALRFKTEDKEVAEYIAYMDKLSKYINSKEYADKAMNVVNNKTGSIDFGELLSERIPYYSVFKNLFFLIYPFGLLSIVFMLGNLILRPLAIVYAIVLRKAL